MGLSAALSLLSPAPQEKALVSTELMSLPGVPHPSALPVCLRLPLWEDQWCPSRGWEVLPGPSFLSPFHVEVLLLFQSPTMKAGPTWMPPKCGGMTGNSFTRSPSRSCRSRWGSEPCPRVCTAVCPRVRAGTPPSRFWSFSSNTVTVTLCAGTKKGKLAEPQHLFLFYLSHPKQPSLLQ